MAEFFWLYRPTAPSVRAQSIQVVNAARATAARGHRVTLAVQTPPGQRVTASEVLAFYGITPARALDLRVLPSGNTWASVAFRALFGRWLARTRGRGIVIARSKRYAREALRWAGGHFRLVLEAHEVDSVQLAECGRDPAETRRLEAEVLAAADAVICNAPGTLQILREAHPQLPPAVALHNATLASRVRPPTDCGQGIGYVGSIRATKGLDTLARAARILQEPVTVVGPDRGPTLQEVSGGWMGFEPAIPHSEVPDRLAAFRVLALPLGSGLFGARLTSPLKLWDYLASGVPVVAADTPAIRCAAPGAFQGYSPGNASQMASALRQVGEDRALRQRLLDAAPLRTWDDRAAELDEFLGARVQ